MKLQIPKHLGNRLQTQASQAPNFFLNSDTCFLFQLSQQLDGLLGMLCVDVAPADGASIQQTLKLLEEKLKSVGKHNISAFQTDAF